MTDKELRLSKLSPRELAREILDPKYTNQQRMALISKWKKLRKKIMQEQDNTQQTTKDC